MVRMIGQRRPLRSDRYYRLTAYFAARDMQTTVGRAVAGSIVALGAVPLVLMASSVGPHGGRDRLLAVTITLCCLAMGGLWVRPGRPSRLQSQLCVIAGSVCIAVACLIEANPVVGLLGATSLAILTAFTMLFHSGRLVAVPWTIGACTLGVVALRLDPRDVAVGAFSVVLVVLLNVVVAVAGRFLIQMLDSELLRYDIEPLTGLLSRDAFYDQVATLIGARSRRDDKFLVVVAVSLDSFALLTALAGAVGGNRARVAISQALREAVRRGTILAHLPDAEFLIAELFTTADPGPLTERVHGTISTAPFGLTASIGAVSTPLPPLAGHPSSDVLDEILSLATDATCEARRAGGNQTRLRLSPHLSSINDP